MRPPSPLAGAERLRDDPLAIAHHRLARRAPGSGPGGSRQLPHAAEPAAASSHQATTLPPRHRSRTRTTEPASMNSRKADSGMRTCRPRRPNRMRRSAIRRRGKRSVVASCRATPHLPMPVPVIRLQGVSHTRCVSPSPQAASPEQRLIIISGRKALASQTIVRALLTSTPDGARRQLARDRPPVEEDGEKQADRSGGKLPVMHPPAATVCMCGRMLAAEDAGKGPGFAALDASVQLGPGACNE
jgi:hypothetical protein